MTHFKCLFDLHNTNTYTLVNINLTKTYCYLNGPVMTTFYK